jgi:thiamine-triphosphatase
MVDVDTTDFGHVVGEVELTRNLQHADGEDKEAILRDQMDQEVRDFMQSCPQAFPVGRPLGKLSAYFKQLSH